MEIPYFSEAEIARLLDYPKLIELMAEAMVEHSQGHVISPIRQMLPIEENQRYLAVMPVAASAGMGAKLVAFYPKNAGTEYHTHLGVIVLFDPETGQPLAFMDGRLITEMRTAATSAAVTRVAAPQKVKKLAILGAGVQGRAHIVALSVDYKFDEIAVWSRTSSKAVTLALEQSANVAASPQKAVADADIVCIATNAREPVLKGAWLKPGCHVNSVGSPRHDWRELDDAVMANTLIVDCRASVLKEAGDVIHSGASIHAEAGEVIGVSKPVDRSQITVFKSVGIAVQDIVTARYVYDQHRGAHG